jgi:hypothetical protein
LAPSSNTFISSPQLQQPSRDRREEREAEAAKRRVNPRQPTAAEECGLLGSAGSGRFMDSINPISTTNSSETKKEKKTTDNFLSSLDWSDDAAEKRSAESNGMIIQQEGGEEVPGLKFEQYVARLLKIYCEIII